MARTTIPAELVAINAIQGTLIADNAITAVHIATNAVSGTLVADNAITSTHIAQNNVTATQIAQNTITVTQLADNSVETDKINNDAVTQAKIADDAVGADQLAANAVVSASIANGTIVAADLANDAVTLAKMASLARGSIIVGDSAGDPSALSIGSNGTVLKSDGTDISWGAGGGDGVTASGSNTIIQSPDDTSVLYINNSANVGIGTTSPANNLHIHTDSGDEGILIKSTGDTSNAIVSDANRGSAGAAILATQDKWNGTTVADMLFLAGSDTTNKDDGVITFRTSSADNITERMRITSTGNIGMPEEGETHTRGGIAKLGINSAAANGASISIHRHYDGAFGGYLVFQKSRNTTKSNQDVVSDNDILGSIEFQGTDGNGYGEGAYMRAYVDGTPGDSDMPTRLAFATSVDGGSSPSDKMVIHNDGKIIHKNYGSGDNVMNFFETQNTSDTGIAIGRNGTNNLKTGLRSSSNGSSSIFQIKLSLGESEGTQSISSPQFQFYHNGNLTTTGSVSSDRRLKENIVNIPDGSTTLIKGLNPVSFNLIGSSVHKAGFIAQEVETVKSSLVNGGEIDEQGDEVMRGVDYYGILAHAVKAIQELEARIKTLEG